MTANNPSPEEDSQTSESGTSKVPSTDESLAGGITSSGVDNSLADNPTADNGESNDKASEEQCSGENTAAETKPEGTTQHATLSSVLSPYFGQKGFPVTKFFVLINVATFIVLVGVSGFQGFWEPEGELLINWGADYGPNTFAGEYWRILSSTFIHIGIVHLVVNMFALWSLGESSERLFGSKKFFAVYLVSGIGGSLVSLLFSPHVVSAGASGAIFGVYGSLVAFFLHHRDSMDKKVLLNGSRAASAFIIYNLFLGFVFGFDNAAHIGGLLMGLVCGFAALPDLARSKVVASVVSIFAALPILFVVASYTPFDFSGAYGIRRAYFLLERGAFTEAQAALDKLCKTHPEAADMRLARAILLQTFGKHEEALDDLKVAVKSTSEGQKRVAYRLRTEVFLDLDRPDEALADTFVLLNLGDNEPKTHTLRARALLRKGDLPGSLKECELALKREPRGSADIYTTMAKIKRQSADVSGALKDVEQALSLESTNSEALALRYELHADANQFEQALKDIEEMQKRDTTGIESGLRRASLYKRMGEKEKSLAEISLCIKKVENTALKGALPFLLYQKACVLLTFMDYEHAMAEAENAAALLEWKTNKSVYAVIWAALCNEFLHHGDKAVSLLKDASPKLSKAWPYPVVSYLCGDLSEQKLLDLADNNGKKTEANTYIGMKFAANGDEQRAKELFRWVVAEGTREYVEVDYAAAQLKHLDGNEKRGGI